MTEPTTLARGFVRLSWPARLWMAFEIACGATIEQSVEDIAFVKDSGAKLRRQRDEARRSLAAVIEERDRIKSILGARQVDLKAAEERIASLLATSPTEASVGAALAAAVNADHGSEALRATVDGGVNLARFFNAKAAWSRATFGDHQNHVGVIRHIRKELEEIDRNPNDLVEWVDVVLLAIDGAWRCAKADGTSFAAALTAKHEANVARDWPKSADPSAPIEHVRTLDERLAVVLEYAKPPEPTREQLIAELAEARADAKRWAERVKVVEARAHAAVRELTGVAMTDLYTARFYGLLLLAALCIARGCLAPPPVAAQADDLVAVVVGLTAHEAGVDALADADGIYAVLVHGGERHGITPVQYARRYSPRFFAGTSARPWARALSLDCSRPAHFVGRWDAPRAPGARSGATSRHDACVALVEHVRVLVQAPPVHDVALWGSRDDFRRAEAAGRRFRYVTIEGARNRFATEVRR